MWTGRESAGEPRPREVYLLGYEFRPRYAKNTQGEYFTSAFLRSAGKIRDEMRGWRIARKSEKSIEDLSRMFNPVVRG